jgi:tRNA (guanine37-N1)-methyltransferase
MLSIDVLTIFPRMIAAPVAEGIVRRAQDKGLAAVAVHDLRDFSDDRHRSVDDTPFGGGPGMVMCAEPFFRAVESLLPQGRGPGAAVVLLSPRGRPFDQQTARRYATLERLVLLCGRYEGIDERVAEGVASEELSLGDFVLTGGEVAALAVIEAAVRLLPGALGDGESAEADSFGDGLLDFPHYTRPQQVRGRSVPEVLLSGDHGRIRRWRRREALRATLGRRPELLQRARLAPEDQALLREIQDEPRPAAGRDGDKELIGSWKRQEVEP